MASNAAPDPHGVKALLSLLRQQQESSRGASAASSAATTSQPAAARQQQPQPIDHAPPQRALPTQPEEDLSDMPLSQAVPLVKQMLKDPSLVAELRRLKKEQDIVEDDLHSKRERLIAAMIARKQGTSPAAGTTVSGPLEDQLDAESKGRLNGFDRGLLKRWDELQSKQQAALQNLRLPCFAPTSRADSIRRQEKIMEMVEQAMHDHT